jgi:hypothetical protein
VLAAAPSPTGRAKLRQLLGLVHDPKIAASIWLAVGLLPHLGARRREFGIRFGLLAR